MPDQLISTFDSGREGWRLEQPDPRSRLKWGEDGGDPGGYLRYNDPGHENFFGTIASPAALKGDLGAFEYGTLSFDLYSPEQPAFISVILNQDDGRSVFAYARLVGGYDASGWNHYSLDLDDDTFVGDATYMELVLGNLDSVLILPRYGSSGGGIDNLAFTKPPFQSPPMLATSDEVGFAEDTSIGAGVAIIHAPLAPADCHCVLA